MEIAESVKVGSEVDWLHSCTSLVLLGIDGLYDGASAAGSDILGYAEEVKNG